MCNRYRHWLFIILIAISVIGCQTTEPNTALPTAMSVAQLPTADSVPVSVPTTVSTSDLPPINLSYSSQVAYQQARQRVLNWQTDAQLISFLTSWSTGSTFPEIINGSDPSWYLLFYSSSSSQFANLLIDKNGISSFTTESVSTPPPTALNINQWRVQEEMIFQEMKNRGVEQFLADYGKSSWQFTLDQNGSQLEWTILGTAHEGNQLFQLNIDATTGRGLFFKIIN